jgi:predicted DNA-binding transcriptional regulator AlpA
MLRSGSNSVRSGWLIDEALITGKQLRQLLGDCSEMHIWRLINDERYKSLAFPRPIKINDRNYWRFGAIREWLRQREDPSQMDGPRNGDKQQGNGTRRTGLAR